MSELPAVSIDRIALTGAACTGCVALSTKPCVDVLDELRHCGGKRRGGLGGVSKAFPVEQHETRTWPRYPLRLERSDDPDAVYQRAEQVAEHWRIVGGEAPLAEEVAAIGALPCPRRRPALSVQGDRADRQSLEALLDLV